MSKKQTSTLEANLDAAMKAQQDLEQQLQKLKADQAYVLERTKLSATSWSNLATNLVTVAVFTPAVGLVYNGKFFDLVAWDYAAAAVGVCLLIAFFLHYEAKEALRKGLDQ